MTLRDRFGHFVRQAVAAPAEAPEVVTAAERAAVEELEDEGADFDVPETPTNLHQRLAELRAQRADLLRDGAVDRVLTVNAEIARCMVAVESAQAQADRFYAEAPARERARLLDLWQRVHLPKLQAAWAERDAAAYQLWLLVDQAADAEYEASAVAAALGIQVEQTPRDSVLTRFLWERWAGAHHARLGQVRQRAA